MNLSLLAQPLLVFVSIVAVFWADGAVASENGEPSAADRGYRFLIEKAYLPPDFDQETFDQLWKVWPPDLQEQAKVALV